MPEAPLLSPASKSARNLKPFVWAACFVLSVSGALADVGIGLRWNTESAVVPQNAVSCVTYTLFNSYGENVNGALVASGSIAQFYSPNHSDPDIGVPSGTGPPGIPSRICFDVKQVYPESCALGPFLCRQACPAEEVTFRGEVVAVPKRPGAPVAGTGSAAGIAVSAPLTLRVACTPTDIQWGAPGNIPLWAILGAAGALGLRTGLHYRKPAEVRRQMKAEKLRKKLEELESGKKPPEPRT